MLYQYPLKLFLQIQFILKATTWHQLCSNLPHCLKTRLGKSCAYARVVMVVPPRPPKKNIIDLSGYRFRKMLDDGMHDWTMWNHLQPLFSLALCSPFHLIIKILNRVEIHRLCWPWKQIKFMFLESLSDLTHKLFLSTKSHWRSFVYSFS